MMNMLKKRVLWFILALAVLCAAGSACQAEIIPPHGEGQIGLQAVVLCETLTARQEPGAASKSVKALDYGSFIIVMKVQNGWAECLLSDSIDEVSSVWVNADYIAIDPAWYRTDETTPVYAWNDPAAPKVALLGKGETLPILKDAGDWLVVSLRGAAGWIQKTAADR